MAKTSRGRRDQKKEKKEEKEENQGVGFIIDEPVQEQAQEQASEVAEPIKPTFFGLVDSNEIDYFKQAESTLNIDSFETPEERTGFVSSVLQECRGKELKLVTNQICSKLMERLVMIGKDKQIKYIMKQFTNHFVQLASHKYSSHVVETLLVRVAAIIEKEIVNDPEAEAEEEEEEDEELNQAVDHVTTEHLFIQMLNEFKPHLNIMVDHQYASHVLRLVVLIISGKELPSTTVSNSTLRSKKSKIARKMIEIKDSDIFNRAFQVPASFKTEIKEVCQALTKNQTPNTMRQLAIHKIASPVIQLLLQVEGIVDKDRAVWHLMFLKENDDKDPQEEAFVEYLLSDSVGSHFMESLIKNQGVRMKYIERLYKLYMKERVLKLAKRSSTGVFIIQALLFKLKPGEVQFMLDQIVPELTNLISISENQNLELSTKVIDASIQRKNYKRDEIISQLFQKFAPNYNPQENEFNSEDTQAELFENVLRLSSSTLGNTRDDWPTAEERRRSLLLEKLMEYDYSFVVCVWNNFLVMPQDRFFQMCKHGVFSHVVDHSLKVIPEESKDISLLRKRFLNVFQNHIVDLACNSYGSHIVDKLWDFTILHNMYKDRIANELASQSHKVKDSNYGKMVWKNWSMELFSRKKYDWKSLIKQQEITFFNPEANPEDETRAKKPIELKLEQMYQQKQREAKRAMDNEEGYRKRQRT